MRQKQRDGGHLQVPVNWQVNFCRYPPSPPLWKQALEVHHQLLGGGGSCHTIQQTSPFVPFTPPPYVSLQHHLIFVSWFSSRYSFNLLSHNFKIIRQKVEKCEAQLVERVSHKQRLCQQRQQKKHHEILNFFQKVLKKIIEFWLFFISNFFNSRPGALNLSWFKIIGQKV